MKRGGKDLVRATLPPRYPSIARGKAKRRVRFFPYFGRLDTVVEKRGRKKKLNGGARDICGRVGGPWSTRLGAPDA